MKGMYFSWHYFPLRIHSSLFWEQVSPCAAGTPLIHSRLLSPWSRPQVPSVMQSKLFFWSWWQSQSWVHPLIGSKETFSGASRNEKLSASHEGTARRNRFPSGSWKHMSFTEGANWGEILELPSDPYEKPVVVRIISLPFPPKMPIS